MNFSIVEKVNPRTLRAKDLKFNKIYKITKVHCSYSNQYCIPGIEPRISAEQLVKSIAIVYLINADEKRIHLIIFSKNEDTPILRMIKEDCTNVEFEALNTGDEVIIKCP